MLQEEKAAAVERLQRIEAYNMELALQKMEDEKQRVAELGAFYYYIITTIFTTMYVALQTMEDEKQLRLVLTLLAY